MRTNYDVVVVGAGPAGSVAARKIAERGWSVLLIEKRQEIGSPVRCAEAIGVDSTRSYIEIDPRWVNATVHHFAIYGSNGDHVIVPPSDITLVVDRKVFDWELAHLASRAGAEVRTRTEATGLIREKDRLRASVSAAWARITGYKRGWSSPLTAQNRRPRGGAG